MISILYVRYVHYTRFTLNMYISMSTIFTSNSMYIDFKHFFVKFYLFALEFTMKIPHSVTYMTFILNPHDKWLKIKFTVQNILQQATSLDVL